MFRSPLPPPCENEIEIDCIVFYLQQFGNGWCMQRWEMSKGKKKPEFRTWMNESENENESYSRRKSNKFYQIKKNSSLPSQNGWHIYRTASANKRKKRKNNIYKYMFATGISTIDEAQKIECVTSIRFVVFYFIADSMLHIPYWDVGYICASSSWEKYRAWYTNGKWSVRFHFDWPNQQSMEIYIFYHNFHAVRAHAPPLSSTVPIVASPLLESFDWTIELPH